MTLCPLGGASTAIHNSRLAQVGKARERRTDLKNRGTGRGGRGGRGLEKQSTGGGRGGGW